MNNFKYQKYPLKLILINQDYQLHVFRLTGFKNRVVK